MEEINLSILHSFKSNNEAHKFIKCLQLEEKIDFNEPDEHGQTGLFWACWKGHFQVVKLRVKQSQDMRLDLNKANKDGMTHYQSHHARKTLYQCEQCPKTFWMKSYLSTHVRMIHDKIRPNKCDICQEGFYYKRDLVSHKKHVHNIYE